MVRLDVAVRHGGSLRRGLGNAVPAPPNSTLLGAVIGSVPGYSKKPNGRHLRRPPAPCGARRAFPIPIARRASRDPASLGAAPNAGDEAAFATSWSCHVLWDGVNEPDWT